MTSANGMLKIELNGRIFRINEHQHLGIHKINEDVANFPLLKSNTSLPKASFKVLPDERPSNFRMPDEYVQYDGHETRTDESRIEYDIDKEDAVWLKLANERRKLSGLKQIKEETLELAIDRLEKESHFQISAGGGSSEQGNPFFCQVDDDVACCICNDADDSNANQIIFCDMCNIPVHQECYGVPYIPEGQWLCRRCQLSPSAPVSCVLCPYAFGAFKQTSCGQWAHVTCALWINEVHFANAVFNEPIEGVEDALVRRAKLRCIICRQKMGACLQCSSRVCRSSFHVTCAVFAGLFMEVSSELGKKNADGVQRVAFCQKHFPESRRPDLSESSWKRLLKRQMLNAKIQVLSTVSEAPQISVPVIPREKVETIRENLKLDRMEDICYYWALKRRSRFGVPLIRRLQVYQSQKTLKRKINESQHLVDQLKADASVDGNADDDKFSRKERQNLKNSSLLRKINSSASVTVQTGYAASGVSSPYASQAPSPATTARAGLAPLWPVRRLGMGDGMIVGNVVDGVELTPDQIHVLRLRANLERVRLLCELVKKREKMKREFAATTEAMLDRCAKAATGATLDNFVSKGENSSKSCQGNTDLSIMLDHLKSVALIKETDLNDEMATTKAAKFESNTKNSAKKEEVDYEDDLHSNNELGEIRPANKTPSSTLVNKRPKTNATKNESATKRGGKNPIVKHLTNEKADKAEEKPLKPATRKRKTRIDEFFVVQSPPVASTSALFVSANAASVLSTPAARFAANAYRIRRDGLVEARRIRRRSSNWGASMIETFSSEDFSAGDLTATSLDEDDEENDDSRYEIRNLAVCPAGTNRLVDGGTGRRGGRQRGICAPFHSLSATARGRKKLQTLDKEDKAKEMLTTKITPLKQVCAEENVHNTAKRKRRLPARLRSNEFDSCDPNIFAHNDIVWAHLNDDKNISELSWDGDNIDGGRGNAGVKSTPATMKMPARVIDLRMRAFFDDSFSVDRALRMKPPPNEDGRQEHTLVMFFDAAKTWKWVLTRRLAPCDFSILPKNLPSYLRSSTEGNAAWKRARQFWNEMLRE